MFWDLFPMIRLPLARKDFERLRGIRHPAYKYELVRGETILTPRPNPARAVLDLASWSKRKDRPRRLFGEDSVLIRPLGEGDWKLLPTLLETAHSFEPPFSLLSETKRSKAAKDLIEFLRTGGEGVLMDRASAVAVDGDSRKALVGAVIVTKIPRRKYFWEERRQAPAGGAKARSKKDAWIPHLTWALVHAWEQRHGIGTRLLGHAVGALAKAGHKHLTSTFLIGNATAMSWHWRNGFELVGRPSML